MNTAPPPKKRKKGHADERGVALLLALASTAMLAIVLTDFREEQMSDLESAKNEQYSLQAEYAAKSAVNLERLWLASEPTIRSGLKILSFMFGGKPVPQLPIWEFSNQVLGAFCDASGIDSFVALGGLDPSNAKNLAPLDLKNGVKARCHLTVVDEDRLISLNLGARGNTISENHFGQAFLGLTGASQSAAGASPYDPLFDNADRDGNPTPRAIMCGALMDWADPDEILYTCDPRNFQGGGSAGAEDNQYALLKHPYRVKNAPYDSLEEAHLVRGMGDDFWATFVDPVPNDPSKRVMTVWGQGAINVNTAPAQAILAVTCGLAPLDTMLCNDPTQAATFLTMFGVMRTFTAGMPLFGNGTDFVNTMQGTTQYGKLIFSTTGLQPVRFQSPADAAKNFMTESKVFSIYATAEMYHVKHHEKTESSGAYDEDVIDAQIGIHTVVDYRSAPPIPNTAFNVGQSPTTTPTSTVPRPPGAGGPVGAATNPGGVAGLPPGAGSDALMGALMANPAGNIVYYRVEPHGWKY